MITRRLKTMRGRIFAIFLILAVCIQFPRGLAVEPRSYEPPANTPVIPWKRFSIAYAVRIVGNAAASKVEFYITADGGLSWEKYGEDPDRISPMVITVPGEGTYGLITAVSTNVRPAFPPRPGTRPDRFVIVDRTPPQAQWLSPTSEQILLTEAGIELAWISSDPHLGLTPVDIEYSIDGGNFWLPLREKLPAKGSINWTPPVLEGQTDIALRLIATDLAGNKRIVRNKATFTLDNEPPVVTILGPSSSGSFKFDIDYTVTDNESGVKNVELYYTVDGGTEWFYFGPDADLSSPIPFSAPAAKEVGLYIVATDKNGNKTPSPARGAMPMAYVTLDLEPPQVSILPPFTTSGEVIAMNNPVDIRWNASDANIKEGSTQIQLSRDGGATWTDLTFDREANGSWQWVPSVAGNNLLLKVSVSDLMGNIGTAVSMPFSVDEKRPAMQFESITPIDNNAGMEGGFNTSQPQTDYSSQNDDLWAPPVPSTVELESETITDLPAPEDSSVKTGGIEAEDNPFGEITDDSGTSIDSEVKTDIEITDNLDLPPMSGADSVPTLNDSFANNEIPDSDFAPLDDTAVDTDFDSSNTEETTIESVQETTEEIPAPPTDDDFSDLGLDSIPEVPAPTENTLNITDTTTSDSDLLDDSLLNEDNFTEIPEPESLPTEGTNTPPATGTDSDMTFPAIPDIGGSGSDSIEDITIPENLPVSEPQSEQTSAEDTEMPAIPDIPAPAQTIDSTNELGLPPIEDEKSSEADSLGLPPDFGGEIPEPAKPAVDDLLTQAQAAFEDEEDYDKAESLAKEVIKLNPDSAQAYAIIASVLTEKGSYDSAFDYAHKAINLAPESAEYLQILGYAQYQKATEINRMLGSSDLTPAQASNLGSQLITALDQAQEAYSKMLSSTNEIDVKEGYYRLAQVDYFKATRIMNNEVEISDTLRKAIANYQKAYAIGQPDYREVLQIGICNYRLTDYVQAEQWLEKAQEIAPIERAPKEAFFYLALINEKTNRPAEALPFWEKVAEYYPENSSYRKLAQTRISALSGM